MRWCSALAVAAAAAVLTSSAAAGEPFPVTARLLGGPHAYTAGAGAREFRVELRNRSREPLRDVHPVIVFVDRGRKLTADQIRLEYEVTDARGAGGERGRVWRPVPVEHTGNAENVAVVGGENGPGTTLPPGRGTAIALRLRFTALAPAGRVTASATIMERRGRDGDWVGESAGYDFDVVPPRDDTAGPQSPSPARTGDESGGGDGGDGGTGSVPGTGPGTEPGGSPAPGASAGTGPGTGEGPGPGPGKGDETAPGTPGGAAGPDRAVTGTGTAPRLAATGEQHRAPALMLTGAGVLLVVGGAALRFSRRG
ncbi:hypothetical protein [Streptomyces sp. NPDC001070]